MALIVAFTVAAPALDATAAANSFSDDDQSVHETSIEYIAAEGITNGCNPPTNDRYCPERTVTRAEMAAFLSRSTKVPRRAKQTFNDVANSVFATEIAKIAAAGITSGCNPPANDLYCPDDPVTRGQMAAFLARAFDLASTDTEYFNDDDSSIFEGDINAVAEAGITVGCGTGTFCPNSPVTRGQMASFLHRAMTGGGEKPPPLPPPGTNPPGTNPPGGTVPPPPPPGEPGTLPAPGAAKPAGAVSVTTSQSLASVVASHPAGTTFYLEKGVHRMTYVRPKDRNTFVGAPGAILSGARQLTSFTQSGGVWAASGQTQQNEQKGTCIDGYSGCVYPEALFIDGQEIWQVTSLSAVKSGTWYFDYGKNIIYIGDNPAGRLVETSVTPVAFDGSAVGVTIRDLTIEKYATPAQMGAIHGQTDRNGPYGNDWLIEGNEIRYNASSGVALGHNMLVRDNFIHHNGRTGIGSGLAQNATVDGNEISYNCGGTGFLCSGWGGGGIKLAGANGTVMRSNYVHHNFGKGMHVDVQATNSTFDANTVVNNDGTGIFVEVSTGALVRNNVVKDNGFRRPDARGAGITISSSQDVTVTGNQVINNALGIVANLHDREPGMDNLTVTNNVIVSPDGHSGVRNKTNSLSELNGMSLTWDYNTYDLGSGKQFVYGEQSLTTAGWLALNLDKHSTFR